MKNSLLALLFVLGAFSATFAQRMPAPGETRIPHLIVATDIGFQWFETLARFGSLKLEYPLSAYHHVGLHFSKIYSGYSPNSYYYYNESLEKGSFEVGIDAKYFPHGRFTGRKTGFYIGPDIRVGSRKYSAVEYDFLTGTTKNVPYEQVTSKFMFSWGVQWHFGKYAVLDIGAPLGIENYQSKNAYVNSSYGYSSRSFVMMPTLMIGIAL